MSLGVGTRVTFRTKDSGNERIRIAGFQRILKLKNGSVVLKLQSAEIRILSPFFLFFAEEM